MASLDKLLKSVDGIRTALKSNRDASSASSADKLTGVGDAETTKREKIGQISHIVEGLTASCRGPGVVVDAASVSRALAPCCELLLLLCDDPDADVRLQANDGLTKCIRMLMLTHSGRLENELYKEIKKNGNARSLRAALTRFGIVAPRIRIPKRRAYAANISSAVIRICAVREEESVWETLVSFMQSVWPTLGPYFLDSENRKLVKTLFVRLREESIPMAVRRNAGQCLAVVCKFARDPEQTLAFAVDIVADEGIKLLKESNGFYLHGCLMLLRCLLPVLADLPVCDTPRRLGTSLKSVSASESSTSSLASSSSDFVHTKESTRLNQYLFIYEVGLRSTQSRNTSICTAALELLQVLLTAPPSFFAVALKDPGGIGSQSRLKGEEHESAWENMSMVAGSIIEGRPGCDETSLSAANDDLESLNSFLVGPQRAANTLLSQRSEDGSVSVADPGPAAGDCDWDAEAGDADGRDVAGDGAYCGLRMGVLTSDESDGYASAGKRRPSAGRDLEDEGGDAADDLEMRLGAEAGSDRLTMTEEDFDLSAVPTSTSAGEDLGESLLPGIPNRTFGDVGSFHFPEPQLHFCARVVGNSFLLMGRPAAAVDGAPASVLVPESVVRVSLQANALAILANVARLEPRLLQLPVNVAASSSSTTTAAAVSFAAVLDLASHRDPVIRANLATLCGSAAGAAFRAGLGQTPGLLGVPFQAVWDPVVDAVFDASPVVSRAGLRAVALVAGPLLRSDRAAALLRLARQLPTLARDSSYWLVKVELLSVVSDVPTAEIEFLLRPGPGGLGETYRERCLESVVLPLLGDENPKVRTAAAKALVQISTKTPNAADVWDGSPVSASAAALTPSYRDVLSKKSLSRVVTRVFQLLHEATAPDAVVGALEALSELARAYAPRDHRASWYCSRGGVPGKNCQALGYLGLLINLTTSRAVCSDLSAVTNLLAVATLIFEGLALECVKPVEKDPKALPIPGGKWEALNHPQLEVVAQLLLAFVVRILCMSAACVSDLVPSKAPFATPSKEALLPSPTSSASSGTPPPKGGDQPKIASSGGLASPVKRMIKAVGVGGGGGGGGGGSKPPESPSSAPSESDESPTVGSGGGRPKRSVGGTAPLGAYSHLPEVVRLHDVLRGMYDNFKCIASQDQRAEKKIMLFLKEALDGFGRVVEFATASEVGLHAEEILSYVQALMPLCPAPALGAVERLLHCLFSSNTAAVGEKERTAGANFLVAFASEEKGMGSDDGKDPSSFYQAVFGGPYRSFATTVKGVRTGAAALAKRPVPVRGNGAPSGGSLLIRTGPTANRAHLSSFIRLFEPIVIYSLKIFTSSAEVSVQVGVLSLLVTLIRLRVNYLLLDNEQVFLNYVLRQFELVEEGLVAGPDSPVEQILPWLLRFLVLLSHDSIHSKGQCLVPFAKLIQLCDGLMASDFDKETHCLPAMGPLVEDLFMWRPNPAANDKAEELETQKEVVLTMLVRLLPAVQVVKLITIAVTGLRETASEEMYRRTSRHVLDAVLPTMSKWELNLESLENARTVSAFFAALSPSAFRPFDPVLRLMVMHPNPEKFRKNFLRWIAGVNCCLGVVITHGNEDVVLSRLVHADLVGSMVDESSGTSDLGDLEEEDLAWVDPLGANQSPKNGSQLMRKSEEKAVFALARFLLDTIALAGKETAFRATCGTSDSTDASIDHLVNLLMHVSHMVQSGEFRKTAAAVRDLLVGEDTWEKDLHDVLVKLGFADPLIPLYWMNLLSLLNCGRISLWSQILRGNTKTGKSSAGDAICCYKEVVKRGTLIVYCDFVHENLVSSNGCGEELTWLLVNHLKPLICLHKEPPVTDLVAAVHRNCVTSLLLVHAVRLRLQRSIEEPKVSRGVLACLSDCPPEVGFALLELCVHVLMPSKILAASYKGFRMAESIVASVTEDEERHRARGAGGVLVVPNASAAQHSDFSEEEDDDEAERRKRGGRKMVRLLELQEVKASDLDVLVALCDGGVVRKRYPEFAEKLRRLRVLAFGDSELEAKSSPEISKWKAFTDNHTDDELSSDWSDGADYPAFRRSVDGVIAAALRRNDQLTVGAAAALISGLTMEDALKRFQDEDFPTTALPAVLSVEDALDSDVGADNSMSDYELLKSDRARGGGLLSTAAVGGSSDNESSVSTASTGPFAAAEGDGKTMSDGASPSASVVDAAAVSSDDLPVQNSPAASVKSGTKAELPRQNVGAFKSAVAAAVAARMAAFVDTLPSEKECQVFMPTSWSPTEPETDYTEAVLECLFGPGPTVRSVEERGSGDAPSPSPSPASDRPRPAVVTDGWASVVVPLCECAAALPPDGAPQPRPLARLVLAALEGAKAVAAGDKWRRRRTAEQGTPWTLRDVEAALASAAKLMCRPLVWAVCAENETWAVSVIEAVFAVVEVFCTCVGIPRIESIGKEFNAVDEGDQAVLSASIKASRIASWAHKVLQRGAELTSLEWNILPLVVSVSRFPVAYGFARVPAELLPGLAFVSEEGAGDVMKQKFVWKERYDIPSDALLDPETLKDYLWRLQLLGWTNRTDFEESWMVLLAVIGACVNASSGGGGGGDATSLDLFGENGPSPAESAVLARAGTLGLAGLIGLLRQTMLLPIPGFPFASEENHAALRVEGKWNNIIGSGYVRVPWAKRGHGPVFLACLDFVLGTLRLGRDSLPNSPLAREVHAAKLPTWSGPGQELSYERKRCLQALGVDIHSCVHFLCDLLSQWTKIHSILSPILVLEILKSKALTLDLVTEFGQAQVLHDSFVEFKKNYANAEDELVVPYLVTGLARTTAILASRSISNYEGGKVGEFPEPSSDELHGWEVLRECVVQALRGIPLSSQVSGLRACEHVMETKWAKLIFMTSFPILPEYLRINLIGASTFGSYLNERHVTAVWETAFSLLKDFSNLMAESDLQTQVHLVCLEVISSVDRMSPPILRLIEGVMKLARVHTLDVATRDLLIKVCSRHFGRLPLSVAVPVSNLQLVLLDTYETLQSDSCQDIAKEHVSNEISLVAQEWVNHIFFRMGTNSFKEADEWAKILPNLPEALIPPSELVNKLLSEFISSKQGHVVQVARVLMRVLGEIPAGEAIEWCLLSVGAFLQRSPLSVALWFVTTLLLGVCVTQWQEAVASRPPLASRAPLLNLLLRWHLSRPPGAFRRQDFWLLSLAVSSFLDMLKSDEQVEMVLSAFASVCGENGDPATSDVDAELKPALLGLLVEIKSRM